MLITSESLFFVFDVESVGLHGEAFAFGYVVVDRLGQPRSHGYSTCSPKSCRGDEAGRSWVRANCPWVLKSFVHDYPQGVRDDFWRLWQQWKAEGALLAADVPWPVESRFLADCIDDNPDDRRTEGPYPLLDIASIRCAAGFDPLATEERLLFENPAHDPLADARQSARLLIESLDVLDSRKGK
jgi:hypothetical protein